MGNEGSMKTHTIRVGYAGVHLGTYYAEEHDQFGRAITGLHKLAAEIGFVLIPGPGPIEGREQGAAAREFFDGQDLDLLLIHAASCSLADPLLELAELGVPLALWGVPEPVTEGDVRISSFVTLEIFASTLRTYVGRGSPAGAGRTYKWFYGEVDEPAFGDRLGVTVRALRAAKTLRGARIGLVGDVAPGFYNLTFDEALLRSKFGVEIVRTEIRDVVAAAKGYGSEEVRRVRGDMEAAARAVHVDQAAMDRAARVYLALRDLADASDCSALAVRDWPEFQELYQMSPLLSMAWLTESREIPVACEGDSLGALCMIALAAISGNMPTLVDFGFIDRETESVLLWHLGSSPHRMADDAGVTYEVHSTLGRNNRGGPWGVVVDQVYRPGPVTITNLSHGGTDLLAMGGRIDAHPSRGFSGDRGWSSAHTLDGHPIGLDDLVNTILVAGLAHHSAIVPGDWTAELTEFGAWLELGAIHRIASSRALQVDR